MLTIIMLALGLAAGALVGGNVLAFITHGDWRMRRRAPRAAAVPSAAAIAPPVRMPTTNGHLGATPRHYRAIGLLLPRSASLGMQEALVALRVRMKTIKEHGSETVRADALRLLDHYADLADDYARLNDSGEIGDDGSIDAAILRSTVDTETLLAGILSGESPSRDRFDTITGYLAARRDDAATGRMLQAI